MSITMSSHWFAATLGIAALAPLSAQCWTLPNSTPGSLITYQTGQPQRVVALPFPFLFDGVTYDHITISNFGFLWLGDGGASSNVPDAAAALAGPPRIMPCWWNMSAFANISNGGRFVRVDPTQVAVVWKGLPETFTQFGYFEVVLTASGTIAFRYDPQMNVPPSTTVVGISAGNGAAANPRNWTNDLPGPTPILGATGTEQFAPATFDLVGRQITFTPTDAQHSTFQVATASLPVCPPATFPAAASHPLAVGRGCPAGGAIYEQFTTSTGSRPFDLANTSIEFVRNGDEYTATPGPGFDTSYAATGVALSTAVDRRDVTFGAMGTFAFGNNTVTTASLINDGYLWLPSTVFSDFTPTVAEFLDQTPRVAPLWTDLTFPAGSSLYWENSNPAFCRATWVGAAELGSPTSSNTFQLTLRSNGNIVFSYAAMAPAALSPHAPLVGITGGAATRDLGPTDLAIGGAVQSVTRVISTPGPMTLSAGGPASVGVPLTLSSTVPPPAGGIGIFVFGLSNPAAPGDGIGMPGCTAYASFDEVLFAPFVGSPVTKSFPIPYTQSLVGVRVFAQAAAALPLNAFGIVASNGIDLTLGL